MSDRFPLKVPRIVWGALAFAAIANQSALAEGVTATAPWPVRLRQDMARLADVEWRLRTAAADQCAPTGAGGIVIDEIHAYGSADWPLLRETLGLGDLPQIAHVVHASPADRAGIRQGDSIVSINGTGIDGLLAHTTPALRAVAVERRLADASGDVHLVLQRKGHTLELSYRPLSLCGERFIIKTENSLDAYREHGTAKIAVTTGLIEFTTNDDELALIAGHEFAHVLKQDGKPGSITQRRAIEDAADELGANLAKCAGYDVSLALGFWRRFERRDILRFFRDRTHRSPHARIERLTSLQAGMTCPAAAPRLPRQSKPAQSPANQEKSVKD